MTIEIAIVADDLTGALDTSAPFVAAGYRVAAAMRPDALAAALAEDAEVVVVNTASRSLPEAAAVAAVRQVALQLDTARPSLMFKKIDSRLKGNVGAETAAIAAVMGFAAIRVAVAVPEQERFTRNGAVFGRGVQIPIPVAPVFAGLPAVVEDADSDAELDRIAARSDWPTTLAVGARGLGSAFARRRGQGSVEAFPRDDRTLFVIGSRDAISAQQISVLSGVGVHDAPQGRFEGPVTLPACLRCTGADDDPGAVAGRLAASAAGLIAATRPRVLVLSGGDTALAVLDRLGTSLIRPRGEALGGLPWFTTDGPGGQQMVVVVKSGGFGDRNSLAALLPANAGVVLANDR